MELTPKKNKFVTKLLLEYLIKVFQFVIKKLLDFIIVLLSMNK